MREELLQIASKSGLFESLRDTLGFIDCSEPLLKPNGLADIGRFRKEWIRYLRHLESSGFPDSDRREIQNYFSELIHQVYNSATRLYVNIDSLFQIKAFSTTDLSYSVPPYCAGCADTSADKKKKIYVTAEDNFGIKHILTLEFPFCRKCGRNAELFISSVFSLEFANPSYGYAFAIGNDIHDYRISFSKDERYIKIKKKLSKLGKEDLCRGIPVTSIFDMPDTV